MPEEPKLPAKDATRDWVARSGLLVLGFICIAQELGVDIFGGAVHAIIP